MKAIILSILVLIIVAIILSKLLQKKATLPEQVPVFNKSTINDKIILIKNISSLDLKRIIEDFSKTYNYTPAITGIKIKSTSFTDILTFQNDIDFETFCFFLNYLQYPIDIPHTANVTGWGTFTEYPILGEKTMFYIPATDKEYDNVYAVTATKANYKIPFTNLRPVIAKDTTAYMPPPTP